MKQFKLKELEAKKVYALLAQLVVPRPIAWVSTISEDGKFNLSPFSFFNVSSIDPPVVGFSAIKRLTDASEKDTAINIDKTGKAVIHLVGENDLPAAILSSIECPADEDEFSWSGLEAEFDQTYEVPVIRNSNVVLFTKLYKKVDFGKKPGSGSLFLMEVQEIKIKKELLTDENRIKTDEFPVWGRAGGQGYVSVNKTTTQDFPRPQTNILGFHRLPNAIKETSILNMDDKIKLANIQWPDKEVEWRGFNETDLKLIKKNISDNTPSISWLTK